MIYKTLICQYFTQNGICTNGDACRYAHGIHELRTNPNAKTKICPFWVKGNCKHGDNCFHAHGNHELKNIESNPFYKTTLCKNFENGSCHMHMCSYAHGIQELKPKPII